MLTTMKMVEWLSGSELEGWLGQSVEQEFIPIFSVEQLLFASPDRLKLGFPITEQARRILLSGFGNGLDRLFEDLISGRMSSYHKKEGAKRDKISPCPDQELAVSIANEVIRLRFSPTRYGYLVVEQGKVVYLSNTDDGKFWSPRNFARETIVYLKERFPAVSLEHVKIYKQVDLLLKVKPFSSYWFYLWVATTPYSARKFKCCGGLGDGDWVLLGPTISISSKAAYRPRLALYEALDRGIQWFLSFPWQKALDKSKGERLNWGAVRDSLEAVFRRRLRKGDFHWLTSYGREVIDRFLLDGRITSSWFEFATEFAKVTLGRRIDKSFDWCREAFRFAFPKEDEL